MHDPIRAAIRDVADFPRPGILFKDITPILASGALFHLCIGRFVAQCAGKPISKIVGIDARGFLFGATVAYQLGIGFIPIRKKGKLPYQTVSRSYGLEYGEAEIEVHTDAVMCGERVVLIDDLLATGGTAAAAIALLQHLGAEVIEAQFLIELEDLGGRQSLAPIHVYSQVVF